ncbi:hypothetical protein [Pelagerythrobacter rhizovicinus]|uniref:NERD domain-containing protein n=1 Tax=Pelagerythrobacter rhizovicinus TaxID=2268576 RepID=A0A4Q2KIX1_9SPHN|nr:hypothetical protein [Pelagerythrobacter rhizovicinus]RXZ64247.1 hypothetical protein ETX26_10060 [Pelagerythrobacter rhizovicinus]
MTDRLDADAWEALFAATPASLRPASTFDAVAGLERRLSLLEPIETAAMLAGLQTDPSFGSNSVRLDMAMRLVLTCAQGDVRPTRDKLYRLLNRDLVDCGINQLEDPPEDFFVTIAATRRGPYRLFQGVWEKAAAFTEDVFEAFGHLPPSPWSSEAFDRAYALLALSDLLADRAGLTDRVTAEDESSAKLDLPRKRNLARIAKRCLVSWTDLARLDVSECDLAPFILGSTTGTNIRDAEPGDSELERLPLMAFAEGILVVAPHNLSIAARAHLIEEAVAHGEADRLCFLLLNTQSERISIAGFARMWDLPTQKIGGHPVRQTIWASSVGRPIHLLQIVDGFEGVPPARFGVIEDSQSLENVVSRSIAFVQEQMRKRPDFREGLSIVLVGGWGRAGSLSLPLSDEPDWDVIALEPEDAATICLAGRGGGKPMDLWRLSKQLRLVEAQGFRIEHTNGWLNLFALWRETRRTLIPEHEVGFQPPASFHYPTDLLLEVRGDAARRHNRNAMPLPDGRFEIVSRFDRGDFFDADKPSFVSTTGLGRGEMLGLVVGRRPVWLQIVPDSGSDRAFDTHETWRAAIHWLEVGLPAFDTAYPDLDQDPVLITLAIEWPPDRLKRPVDNVAIDAAISITLDRDVRTARLDLGPAWQHGLHRADNHAELSLASALLSIVSALAGGRVDRADLYALMQEVVGSDDIRWRHSFAADRPLMLLKAHGLISTFEEVPESASALVRCGSTFLSRPRSAGPRIEGADDCFVFLMAQHGALTERLLETIAEYDRTALVELALSRLVSALAEDQSWTLSARALRAIHGAEKDFERSLSRRSEINGVIRGASIVVEMAASEAPLSSGRPIGQADVDELLAQALLLFQTAELIPPIRAGFIEPELQISPTGDILYDHAFTRSALVPSVHARHSEARQDADRAYRSHFDRAAEQGPLDRAFEAAVVAEYGIPFDAFTALSGACAELAVAAKTAAPRLRRSELVGAIAALPGYEDIDPAAAIDRLTLPARRGWKTLPSGLGASDFDVSRFDRHFSLIARPIVALDADEDSLLLVSPPLMERSALHNLAGAMQGTLQGKFWTSPAMRVFVGAAAEKMGLDFNQRVAEHIRALGLTSFPSTKVTDALHHKGTDAVKRLGDIDVLALSADGHHAWVIEAKDIRFCRTLGETSSRLSEYRGQTDSRGRRDKLRKHLDRVEYVRAHRIDLAQRYDLEEPPAVHGLVVFESPQPMAFVPSHPSTDARFVMLGDLNGLDWAPRM